MNNRLEEFEKAYKWLEGEVSRPTTPEWHSYFKKCLDNLYEEPLFVEEKGITLTMEWGIHYDETRRMTLAGVSYIAELEGRELFGYCPMIYIDNPGMCENMLTSLEEQKCRVLERVQVGVSD